MEYTVSHGVRSFALNMSFLYWSSTDLWPVAHCICFAAALSCAVWPWGAPGAAPGADGSASRAASEIRWSGAASESAAASGWEVAPAAAAAPTDTGLNLALASSALCEGPTETGAPQITRRQA